MILRMLTSHLPNSRKESEDGNGKQRRGKRQETYNRALHVLARMRRTGSSLTPAAKEEHIDPRTVRKYLRTDCEGRAEQRKQIAEDATCCFLQPSEMLRLRYEAP